MEHGLWRNHNYSILMQSNNQTHHHHGSNNQEIDGFRERKSKIKRKRTYHHRSNPLPPPSVFGHGFQSQHLITAINLCFTTTITIWVRPSVSEERKSKKIGQTECFKRTNLGLFLLLWALTSFFWPDDSCIKGNKYENPQLQFSVLRLISFKNLTFQWSLSS